MAELTAATYEEGDFHPYHIVNPSPWPLLSAFAGMILAIGFIMFARGMAIYYPETGGSELINGMELAAFQMGGDVNYKSLGLWPVVPGLLAVLFCMFMWWRDVLHEAVDEDAHSAIVKISLRYGMILFIASEVMFFVAFFWAFFHASLFYSRNVDVFPYLNMWPPQGIEVVSAFGLPLTMTLTLLLSGATVTWAHHAILEGKQKDAVRALGLTVLLGSLFLIFQTYEYTHAAFGISDTVYGSAFFMATGFHGFHVFVGTIFLFVCLVRAKRGRFTPDDHFGFEAAAWYWHFVDVVWLFLFLAIYVWGS